MRRVLEWCVPSDAFWSWRDQIAVFYDAYWITIDHRQRVRYKRIYGVDYR